MGRMNEGGRVQRGKNVMGRRSHLFLLLFMYHGLSIQFRNQWEIMNPATYGAIP
jgi:hypothetical protein